MKSKKFKIDISSHWSPMLRTFLERNTMDLSTKQLLYWLIDRGHRKIRVTTEPVDGKTLFRIDRGGILNIAGIFSLYNWRGIVRDKTYNFYLCDERVNKYFGDVKTLYINSI